MVPPLAALSAKKAAAVMGFRGRTVEMAQRNAGLYGLEGAHFPWETAPNDGHDAAVAPTDWSEQHISLDVALGTLATARALNDSDWNRETAFPVVSNVAAWLLSRGSWTSKGFEVLHMGGPDETLGQVNNSNFFNLAGMLVLEGALDLAKHMPPNHVDAAKLKEWEEVYSAMVLPETDGVWNSRPTTILMPTSLSHLTHGRTRSTDDVTYRYVVCMMQGYSSRLTRRRTS